MSRSKSDESPGTLINSEKLSTTGIDGTVYLVEYWSNSGPKNASEMVTGLVYVPNGTPPKGGWPVVSWAHGTTGIVGACAPSLAPSTDLTDTTTVNDFLSQGWEVVATDYQGEGNSQFISTQNGLQPYLVGNSAAANVIDIVLAAGHLSAADASSKYVALGYSEGGQAVMYVLEDSASYAPSLTLEGVVGLAPPSDLTATLTNAETGPYWPLVYLATWGLNAYYGNKAAPLSQLLTATGSRDKSLVETQCIDSIIGTLDPLGFDAIFKTATLPKAWESLADDNDPATFTTANSVPVLEVQGEDDTIVPPFTSAALASHLCGIGQDVERWLYPGLTHTTLASSDDTDTDVTHWIADRFAGGSNPDPYVPSGEAGITTTTCSSS